MDDLTCKAGTIFPAEKFFLEPDDMFARSLTAAENGAKQCAARLEESTRLPHYVEKEFHIFEASGYAVHPLDGCKPGAHISGESSAKQCAQELERITGTPFASKLVSSVWFWFNEYAVQSK